MSVPTHPSPLPVIARRHASARWVGFALMLPALASLGTHIWAVAEDAEPTARIMLGVFATLTSLGAFGTHDDTTLHALREADASGVRLPDDAKAELTDERRRRPERVRDVLPHPRASWVMLAVAFAGVTWSLVRAYEAYQTYLWSQQC